MSPRLERDNIRQYAGEKDSLDEQDLKFITDIDGGVYVEDRKLSHLEISHRENVQRPIDAGRFAGYQGVIQVWGSSATLGVPRKDQKEGARTFTQESLIKLIEGTDIEIEIYIDD